MTGFDRRTVSPCSSTIIRSTPWVEGCCGPMLRIIVSPAPKAASPASGSRVLLSGNRSTPPCSMSELDLARLVERRELLGPLVGLGDGARAVVARVERLAVVAGSRLEVFAVHRGPGASLNWTGTRPTP